MASLGQSPYIGHHRIHLNKEIPLHPCKFYLCLTRNIQSNSRNCRHLWYRKLRDHYSKCSHGLRMRHRHLYLHRLPADQHRQDLAWTKHSHWIEYTMLPRGSHHIHLCRLVQHRCCPVDRPVYVGMLHRLDIRPRYNQARPCHNLRDLNTAQWGE